MKKLYLSVLWHMHQPYYKDDYDGKYHLPWTFLHAIKDYYEMARYMDEFPGMTAVFNLVPSLLVQIEDYAENRADDIFLTLLKKPAESLNSEERAGLVPQLFMANVKTMIHPLRRYLELYNKRNRAPAAMNEHELFSADEIRDLSVLYLIAWTGTFLRQEEPFLGELIAKQRGFTEEEKLRLIEILIRHVRDIIPLYRRLAEEKRIEISTTPYYHPILPLLIDHASAKEALADIRLPSIMTGFAEDAPWHVAEAVRMFEERFGYRPTGMWPAEGSVSTAAAAMFASHGVQWIASDEDVLAGTVGKNLRQGEHRKDLYHRHVLDTENGPVHVFFRDKVLSDLVGFTYAGWEPKEAAADFVRKLSVINESTDFSPHVNVILDGENAWEYYEDNGRPFFEALYAEIAAHDWIVPITFDDARAVKDIPERRIDRLRAGSWIYGNFTTWIGHPEKNRGWQLLSDARGKIARHINEIDESVREEVMKELHIAEGSDWFWWFGDDHFSLQSDVFDKLFRSHLVNIHRLLNIPVNPELYKPVKRSYKTGLKRKPKYFITPTVDGIVTSFYEWLAAGEFDLKFDTGAMHAASSLLSTLYFGHDDKNFYLRIEGDLSQMIGRDYEIEIEVVADDKHYLSFPVIRGTVPLKCSSCPESGAVAAIGRIIELSIPLRMVFEKGKDKLYIVFRVKKGADVIERAPLYNLVEIDATERFEDEWIV